LTALGFSCRRLKLDCGGLLSNFAFNFNLRLCTKDAAANEANEQLRRRIRQLETQVDELKKKLIVGTDG